MIRLSKRQVLFLHQELVRKTGGIDGLREEELVDIILAAAAGTKGLDDLHQWILDHS